MNLVDEAREHNEAAELLHFDVLRLRVVNEGALEHTAQLIEDRDALGHFKHQMLGRTGEDQSEKQFELRLLGGPATDHLFVANAENGVDHWRQASNQEVFFRVFTELLKLLEDVSYCLLGLGDVVRVGLVLKSEVLEDSKASERNDADVLKVVRDQSLRADFFRFFVDAHLQDPLKSLDQKFGKLHVQLHNKICLGVEHEIIQKLLNLFEL